MSNKSAIISFIKQLKVNSPAIIDSMIEQAIDELELQKETTFTEEQLKELYKTLLHYFNQALSRFLRVAPEETHRLTAARAELLALHKETDFLFDAQQPHDFSLIQAKTAMPLVAPLSMRLSSLSFYFSQRLINLGKSTHES